MSYTFGDSRLPARFWTKVRPNHLSTCWEWTAATAHGYGYYAIGTSISRRAHRVSYLTLVGPIPEGLVLDHLCRVRRCVNPDHLEPVTIRENILRGVSRMAAAAVKVCCIRGHQLAGANLYLTPDGRRNCRTCRIEAARACRRRRALRRARDQAYGKDE